MSTHGQLHGLPRGARVAMLCLQCGAETRSASPSSPPAKIPTGAYMKLSISYKHVDAHEIVEKQNSRQYRSNLQRLPHGNSPFYKYYKTPYANPRPRDPKTNDPKTNRGRRVSARAGMRRARAMRRATALMGHGAGPFATRSNTNLSRSGGIADPSA